MDNWIPEERELTILEHLCQELDRGPEKKHVLPFTFKDKKGTKTSHHLIFVSKHPLVYGIMKDIMAKQSSSENQGVPSFMFIPATERQQFLFEFNRPLSDLEDMLVKYFSGRRLPMINVYYEHHIGRSYLKKNYKQALINLAKEGRIKEPTGQLRKKVKGKETFGDKKMAIFP